MGAGAVTRASHRLSFGPWMWGARADLAVFGGSALLALGLVAYGHETGLSQAGLPDWGWVAFVLGVDVAHVWSTLFRTYLDGEEVRRHRVRYLLVPALCFAAGVALHLVSSLTFWRVLAYVALFHFVRQQVGWVAIYRVRAGLRGRVDKILDEAVVYVSTLYPVVHWHAHLSETSFAWFIQGDFVDTGGFAAAVVGPMRHLWVFCLVAFAARQIHLLVTTRTVHLGRIVVVATTAAIWYVGIVATNSDFDFTVTNVVVHGVPYVALLWFYARERRTEAPRLLGSQVAGWGAGAFVGVLLLLAFAEELAWDRLVYHERAWLFGFSEVELGHIALSIVVPLLSLPQTTHYVLDGMLWRRRDTRGLPAQRAALGFPVGEQNG